MCPDFCEESDTAPGGSSLALLSGCPLPDSALGRVRQGLLARLDCSPPPPATQPCSPRTAKSPCRAAFTPHGGVYPAQRLWVWSGPGGGQ